jgi:hypothetical protein
VQLPCIRPVLAPTALKVFVTSGTYTGNLGGLTGADQKCQGLANAAGLTGTYKAWLSDSNGGTPDTRFTKSLVPYEQTNSNATNQIASSYSDLTDGNLRQKIEFTEEGKLAEVDVSGNLVWTGTLSNGKPSGFTCSDWSTKGNNGANQFASHGALSKTDYTWSGIGAIWTTCNIALRLYCFQQ